MIDEVQQYLENRNVLETKLRAWCEDKSIPLEERWDAFVLSGFGKKQRLGKIYEWVLEHADRELDTDEDRYSVLDTTSDFIGTRSVPEGKEEDYMEFVLENWVRHVKIDW